MKVFVKILTYLMLLILLSAGTCNEGGNYISSEERASLTFKKIEGNFTGNQLLPGELSAFEIKALQKLRDISDYMKIYADSSYPQTFRKQSRQMIQTNFKNDADLLDFYNHLELREDTVNDLLIAKGIEGKFNAELESIVISKNLGRESDSVYDGEISFLHRINSVITGDTLAIKSDKFRINIILEKIRKDFGDNTEDVWSVLFGETKAESPVL